MERKRGAPHSHPSVTISKIFILKTIVFEPQRICKILTLAAWPGAGARGGPHYGGLLQRRCSRGGGRTGRAPSAAACVPGVRPEAAAALSVWGQRHWQVAGGVNNLARGNNNAQHSTEGGGSWHFGFPRFPAPECMQGRFRWTLRRTACRPCSRAVDAALLCGSETRREAN